LTPTGTQGIGPRTVPNLDPRIGRQDLVVQRHDLCVRTGWCVVAQLGWRQGSFSFLFPFLSFPFHSLPFQWRSLANPRESFRGFRELRLARLINSLVRQPVTDFEVCRIPDFVAENAPDTLQLAQPPLDQIFR